MQGDTERRVICSVLDQRGPGGTANLATAAINEVTLEEAGSSGSESGIMVLLLCSIWRFSLITLEGFIFI